MLAEVLVVLRVHGGPAAYLVTDQPEVRRDAIDVADLPDVARAKVHFVLRIEASARLRFPLKRYALASTQGSRSSKSFRVMRLIGNS